MDSLSEANATTINRLDYENVCNNAEEGDDDARKRLEFLIREAFIHSGGIAPISKDNLLPLDLNTLTVSELINILDNMALHENKTNKGALTQRVMDTFVIIGNAASDTFGLEIVKKGVNSLQTDMILRDAITKCFLGKGVNPSPKISLGVSVVSYLAYFVAQIISSYGKLATKQVGRVERARDTESGNSATGVSSDSELQTPLSNASGGKITVGKNDFVGKIGGIFTAPGGQGSNL